MEATSQALARALWPRLRERYPEVRREELLPACWSMAALGFNLEDPDEALWALELLGRYGDQTSALDIREAVKLLGSQADLFLESWVTGLHRSTTGTSEIAVALWEFQAYMTLSPDGAERVRRRYGFMPPPPEIVERERQDLSAQGEHETRPEAEPSVKSPRNRVSGFGGW